ncbi:MAG TPA: ribose ABC transporter permease [Thermoanaerobaculales bacterium]|nr:ribose ABC transporter permease [Thermoanaerobaculales bacterium]HPA81074.1 ribose ABC transporter permease [Thermoanaerobaculales bacterium]HQL30662.1 ribose ABC transporter permease [Thermoanaerobaculales bacterium]HQN95684.1 ribose ABC transporter permease [Thermoanaerobaculales bacterium]HQP43398.1 ribose ABC transporter permease [Thermoanaerobaculales bacterium]
MSRPSSSRLAAAFTEYGIIVAFVVEVIVFSIASEHFLTIANLTNVTLQTSVLAIIAAGMTFVILTAGIDLSVGSLVAISGVVCALLLKAQAPLPVVIGLGLLGGIAVGLLSGLLSGVVIARFSVTPFIATLAMMTIWRGAAYLLVGGRPVWGLPEAFDFLGSGRLAGIPFPTAVMLCVYAVAWFVLAHTPFGRYVYAVGGNPEAARLAGIRTSRVIVLVYVISGVLAAISGILLASRMSSGQPNAGLMFELEVIAAVVVGGTSLFGGRGGIVGTFVGAMLIGVLRNGLNLVGVGSYVQQVVLGFVILLAVMLDQLRKQS